jgi:hypothetical protein
MKKVLFLMYSIFTVSVTSFGQTKKEQIDLLYRRLDSLNIVINSKNIETYNRDSIIRDLRNQIKTINTTLENKELEIIRLKESLFIKDSEILKKTDEIEGLNQLINKLKDTIITLRQLREKLTFHIPPPSGTGTGVCAVTLTIDNVFLLATETCGGHDENGHTEFTRKLFNIEFKRDFIYKVSELINTDEGSSFGCEYFEIKENKLYLYDENKKVINDWFCTIGGFAVNYEENMETCDCIFLPSKN